jgi:hypothetical protein
MKALTKGDEVNFRLDMFRASSGIVVGSYPRSQFLIVKITSPCKGFDLGSKILVSLNEVID